MTGYSHSKIFKSPVTGSTTTNATIHLPPRDTSTNQTSTPNDSVVYPQAHNRAKTFLKTVVQDEVNNLDKYHEDALLWTLLVKYKRKDALVKAFANQLHAFGCNAWPFRIGRNQNTDPFVYWKRLSHDDSTDVLAVCEVDCLSHRLDLPDLFIDYPHQDLLGAPKFNG